MERESLENSKKKWLRTRDGEGYISELRLTQQQRGLLTEPFITEEGDGSVTARSFSDPDPVLLQSSSHQIARLNETIVLMVTGLMWF